MVVCFFITLNGQAHILKLFPAWESNGWNYCLIRPNLLASGSMIPFAGAVVANLVRDSDKLAMGTLKVAIHMCDLVAICLPFEESAAFEVEGILQARPKQDMSHLNCDVACEIPTGLLFTSTRVSTGTRILEMRFLRTIAAEVVSTNQFTACCVHGQRSKCCLICITRFWF